MAAEKPPSAKRPKLGQEKAQVVAPFAPLAPQFSEQKPKAKAARVSETETQTQLPEKCAEASSSSCKVSSKSQEKSDIVQESTGSKRAAPHNNSGPGFTLAESFKWGAVSFKFRKPASYQVDCPNRSHYIRHSWGSTTTCSKTIAFTAENKSSVLRRLKTWAVEGVDCETRDDHLAKSNDIAFRPEQSLPSMEELEQKCPRKVVNRIAGASSDAKPKAKAKAAKTKAAKPTGKKKLQTAKKKRANASMSSLASGDEAVLPSLHSGSDVRGSSSNSSSSSSTSSSDS